MSPSIRRVSAGSESFRSGRHGAGSARPTRTSPHGSASASRTSSIRRSFARRSKSRSPRRTSGSSASTERRPSTSRRSSSVPRATRNGSGRISRTRPCWSTEPSARSKPSSSRPIAAAAATGIGIGPNRIDRVIGVAKAYVTRVGEGPFPTEIEGPDQERVRELGGEYGTVTGRERRCGWLDLVGLRYAVRLNGITALALTKLDVLSTFAELPVCIRYRLRDGTETDEFPAHQSDFHHCEPIYEVLPGWEEPLDGVEDVAALPEAARGYVEFIERELGVKVCLIGTGAGREHVLSQESLETVLAR